MRIPLLKKLVSARLTELDCDLPPAVRAQLEDEIATAWADEATRLVTATLTAKRLSQAFADHLGVRRKSTKALATGGVGGVSGANHP